uniref:Uncharacterized protein n=1 Tax=Arundo donax TaxID=35708 RepID=A0A0A9CYP5_ARUDO
MADSGIAESGNVTMTLFVKPLFDVMGEQSKAVQDFGYERPFLGNKDRLDYHMSVDRFTRRRLKPGISFDDNNGGDKYDDVSAILGLSECSFACLRAV